MNMNRIINMVVRIVMRRAINSGLNFGIRAATRRGSGQGGSKAPGRDGGGPPQDRDMARRQRQAAKAARRIGKF